jgi:hypothetical protein
MVHHQCLRKVFRRLLNRTTVGLSPVFEFAGKIDNFYLDEKSFNNNDSQG